VSGAQGDIFMKIEGIKGESKDSVHKDEMDVLSWNWGASNTSSAGKGGGLGAGKSEVTDLTFNKHIDRASTELLLSCLSGKHFKEAKLTVRKAGGTPLEFLHITMTDVIITRFEAAGNNDVEIRPLESLRLSFASVQVDYTEQNNSGGPGPTQRMGWDIAGNAKR
jgi:type VI secretion system secreted protein Hcp